MGREATQIPVSPHNHFESKPSRQGFAGFILDVEGRVLLGSDGADLPLTASEFELLVAFVRAPGRVLSRDHLRLAVSGRGIEAFDRSVDVLVGRLRRKIEPNPKAPTLIVTVASAGYKFIPRVVAAAATKSAPETSPRPPEGPSLAVLPFDNLTGDPKEDYFVDGVVEEIITALSRVRWFLVSARNSSFAYKGQVVDVRQVGRELGVRYVLAGSMRKAGTRIRIAANLIEAESGIHVWSDRFDGIIADVFDLQDAITSNVVGAIVPRVQDVETERAQRQRPNNPSAYDCFLRGLAQFYSETRESIGTTLRLLRQAIAADPEYAPPYALAAESLVYRLDYGWSEDREHDKREAVDLARAALDRDHNDPTVLVLAAHVLAYVDHDYVTPNALIERALILNPNAAIAFQLGGWIKIYAGDPAAAMQWFDRGKRLSPLDTKNFIYYSGVAFASVMLGRDAEAVDWATKAVASNVLWLPGHHALASALAHVGRIDEAKAVAVRVCAEAPRYRLASTRRLMQPSPGLDRYLDGLRRAGFPD